jgi:signal transduction histidine kinase
MAAYREHHLRQSLSLTRLRMLIAKGQLIGIINRWLHGVYHIVLIALSVRANFSFPVVSLSLALFLLHVGDRKIAYQWKQLKSIKYIFPLLEFILLMALNYVTKDEWTTTVFSIYTIIIMLNHSIYVAFPFSCFGYSIYLFFGHYPEKLYVNNNYIIYLINHAIASLCFSGVRSLIFQHQSILELNQRLKSQAELSAEMTQLRERNKLAEAMHDTIGHTLTSSIVSLEGVSLLLKNRPDEAIVLLDSVREQLQTGLGDIRQTVRTLKTDTLADHANLRDSLFQLIDRVERQTSIEIEIRYLMEVDLLPIQEYVLYSIVREGITNALKHSQASSLQIIFEEENQHCIALTITDNGEGGNSFEAGFGLTHLQQKVNALGGTLSIDTQAGFCIHVLMPLALDRSMQPLNSLPSKAELYD